MYVGQLITYKINHVNNTLGPYLCLLLEQLNAQASVFHRYAVVIGDALIFEIPLCQSCPPLSLFVPAETQISSSTDLLVG